MSLPRFLHRSSLQALVDALAAAGYRTYAPQLHDGAIAFQPLQRAAELPHGIHDRQAPGQYRTERTQAGRCFAFAGGAQALKPLLFAGHELLWEARRSANELQFTAAIPKPDHPLAILGARSCDLAALALHDAHFLQGEQRDAAYAARRAGLFVVAVNCSHPAATCFCASTGDGPQARDGFDLVLDELDEGFLVQAGSRAGEALLQQFATEPATPAQQRAAEAQHEAARAAQTRRLPSRDLHAALAAQMNHPRWDEVAARCLACGNCTAVCPTCFCHAHVEDAALDGSRSRHYRVWDSCFTEGHSYIHGIVIRSDTAKRYRQWLTHKLGSWHQQYGRSGCVGCGRCITWCPVGIDITAETAAIVGEKA